VPDRSAGPAATHRRWRTLAWRETGAGAVRGVGPPLPVHDLNIWAQRRIIGGLRKQLQTVFPTQTFVPAEPLVALPRGRHMSDRHHMIRMFFPCDRQKDIRASGCWQGSLLLGPKTQQDRDHWPPDAALSFAADPDCLNGLPARPCLSISEAGYVIADFERLDRTSGCETGKTHMHLATDIPRQNRRIVAPSRLPKQKFKDHVH